MLHSVYIFSFSVFPAIVVITLVGSLWWRQRNHFCLQPDRWMDEQTVLMAEQKIVRHFARKWENAYMEVPFSGSRIGGYLSIRPDGRYTFYLKDKRIQVSVHKRDCGWLPVCAYPSGSFQHRFALHLAVYLETRLFN